MLLSPLPQLLDTPHYVSEQVGTVEGLQALNEDSDLRKLLILDLTTGTERIASMDVSMATEHQLAMEARWVGEVDGKLERAERQVEVARRLLTKRNLAQLEALLEDDWEVRALKRAISHLPEVNAT
jgi:hypothetical protein